MSERVEACDPAFAQFPGIRPADPTYVVPIHIDACLHIFLLAAGLPAVVTLSFEVFALPSPAPVATTGPQTKPFGARMDC